MCNNIKGEAYDGNHGQSREVKGRYYLGDVLETLKVLTPIYEGKIQLLYMDPPFLTGQTFKYKQRIGAKGWRGSRENIITHIAYKDQYSREKYYNMMEEIFIYAHRLLSNEGSLYVHIDYRTSAYIKIMLDEIFGEQNFLNEIIWHYRSGGRAKRHFSRKHDNILFFKKSDAHYFDIEAVGKPRGTKRRNNMKKNIDEDGNIYWSVKSAGKEYRYYADDKVYPSDVWDDIPHLHQTNPERTGYDTQKPEALLERIVLASSRPGDIVADFFAGSGTTLSVAQYHGRDWIGVDSSIFSLHTCRRRLLTKDAKIKFLYNNDIPITSKLNIDDDIISLRMLVDDIETVDHWGIGYIKQGIYNDLKHSTRTIGSPRLKKYFDLTKLDQNIYPYGKLCIHMIDIYGNQCFYKIKQRGCCKIAPKQKPR